MQFNDIVSSFLYQHDHHRPPQVRPSSTVSQESGAPGQTKTPGRSLPCYCQSGLAPGFFYRDDALIRADDGVGFWQPDHMISLLFANR